VTNIRLLWKCPFRLQRYSFITTLFLGPFDDVITKFYCINTKRKLLRTNAHIWFNQTCQNRNIIPRYANITQRGTSNATKLTQRQAIKLRIKNEIKYLYIKKQNINNQLYKLHLKNVQFWHTNWTTIEKITNDRLNKLIVTLDGTFDLTSNLIKLVWRTRMPLLKNNNIFTSRTTCIRKVGFASSARNGWRLS
jgi:hypothetical protein